MSEFNESSYEKSIIELLENLGYNYIYGPDVDRKLTDPLMEDELRSVLGTINPGLPKAAIDEVIFKIRNYEVGSLVSKNETFMDYLQNGIQVSYRYKNEQKATIVNLVDYDNPSANSFIVANQWSFKEHETKRPDVVIFLNGMPVVVMELKSPKADSVTIDDAYAQIRNYLHDIETFFIYNAFCVISDQSQTRAGTITASMDRFMEWKTVDGDYEETRYADFTTLIRGMFAKSRFLDIIHNFICFSKETGGDVKILAAYHQYFAVKKAVESTIKASAEGGDGRGGVFWHTQGSGKSLSMVFYAKALQSALNSPTIVVITDRNDLDDQLFAQFAKCQDFLRQVPVQAEKRRLSDDDKKMENPPIALMDWLDGRKANGIIFTTMQKFEESDEPLCPRRNIVVMADEAHRSQYGFEEKVNAKTGKITIGNARRIRDCLPNATYIGFTGTPIELEDRNTHSVFGDYIDIYDMTQAVADGATRPIYYESRVIKLELDPDTLQEIDDLYEQLKERANEVDIENSKKELAHMDSVLSTPKVLNSLCTDIVEHYETYRQYEQTGKALIVAYSRPMAVKIYEYILKELRPEWKDKMKIVMTGSNKDPEEWKQKKYTGSKAFREELAREFKDNSSDFKIAIVVDMWLTGFDVPSLSTMYVFKPMKGHNLMQAIARVNRVYKDKEGGLVVDYIGIASALKAAMKQYTVQDQKNYENMDVTVSAYKKFQEKLIVCRELMYGFDYSEFMTTSSDLKRATLITGGVNFLSDPTKQETKENYLKEAYLMRQAFSLSKSIATAEERREEAYLETVRSVLIKILKPGPMSLKDINAQVNELLKQSVQSDGVINLFNGNTLSLTDYIATNMDLDTSSVSISNATLGDDGKLHAGDTAPVGIEVSYNDDARLLSLRKIPDRKPLLLTYTCIARAQGEDTFTNTATLVGGGSHSYSTSEKHTIQTNDAGVQIGGIEMSIHKIDENNISNNLAQAKFQLYECELAIGDLTNTEKYNQKWWDDLLAKVNRRTAGNANADEIAEIDGQFKIKNYKPVGKPKVSGTNGYTPQWTGLNEHKLYAWKEVEAPEGYTGNEDYHYFVAYQHINVNSDVLPQPLLPEAEQLNRKHAAWALDDACQFANGIRVTSMANLTTWTATNVESQYTSISATKVWENDSDNLFETRPEGGIKLQLVRINADGTTENIGEKVSINADDEGNWPTYIWNRLPAKDSEGNALKYTVVEDKVENYSTTYSDGGEGQTSGEITITNRMIPKSTDIYVKKVFDVEEGDKMPSEIKVSLMVIKTNRNGVVGEPEETGYETILSDSNGWSWTFKSLQTTDADGNILAYTAVEDTAALAAQGFRYIVSYSDDGAGVIDTTADEPLVITNSKEYGSITVNKSVLKNNAADEEAVGQTITVGLFSTEQTNGSEILPDDTKTITIGDNSTGSVTFDKLTLGLCAVS